MCSEKVLVLHLSLVLGLFRNVFARYMELGTAWGATAVLFTKDETLEYKLDGCQKAFLSLTLHGEACAGVLESRSHDRGGEEICRQGVCKA